MSGPGRLLAALLVAAAAGAAGAQTMLDQERRLIDIHSLLLDLPPAGAPGSLRPGQVSLGLELIGIPVIDGTTGSKRQITASDRTRIFPRPRLAVGLPLPGAPDELRAFAGLSYIPPARIREVSTHYGAVEAGLAWAAGPRRAGLRGHALYAESSSPVTDPATRDALATREAGLDVALAWVLELPVVSLTPYAGVGVAWLRGRFRVASDGYVLRSDDTALALRGGVRLLFRERWEGVVELEGYPGRLVHPVARLAYLFDALPDRAP